MSIMSKVTEAIVHFIPDRDRDELSDAQRLIGKPIDRVDGRDKVTGHAPFTAEFALENLAHGVFVYATIPRGKIKDLDVAAAEKAPGVVAVITPKNAPSMLAPPLFNPSGGSDAGAFKVRVLNIDEIFWNGQPIAIVVAETLERAEYAASLVKVTYKEESASLNFKANEAKAETPKQVMGEENPVDRGDAEDAFAKSPVTVDHVYRTPRYNHNAIELHATTAAWDGDKLTVYDASQFVRGTADSLGKMFSMDPDKIRVISEFVGGGFGGKGSMWANVQGAVLAAKVVGRPVKLVLSREGVFRSIGGRTASKQRVALGADPSGKLLSLIHTGVTATTPINDFPEQFTFPARHLYATENLFLKQDMIRLDTTPNTFMRAPGESIGTFALESAMDELAYELGMDPIELRKRNEPDRDPAKGTEFSSRHMKEAYALGAEKFGWSSEPRKVRSLSDGKWLIGHGVATAYYPAFRFPASAKIRLNGDGTAVVQTSAQEMGMGTATVQTQHAAERLGLPMAKIRFEYGDSSLPNAPVAGGSNQTVTIALAIQEASEKLQKELLSLAKKHDSSPLSGSHFDDVRATNNGLFRRDKPEVGETYVAILERAQQDSVEVEATTGQPFELTKYAMGSFGAQFCEIRVNEETGEARVARWVGAFDTGRILNPKTARSQFLGGIIMGIGMALTEETLFDERTGRIANATLAEYHVPVNADVPKIEAYFLDIPDPHTALGAHGIGEIGITGAAAAIANAIYHATGKRIRELPITLDKLL